MTDSPLPGRDCPDPWRLDPAHFPKQLHLEISSACLEVVERRARRSGRCRDEVILDMLNRALEDQADR
jgi:hypothetical protein